MQVTLCTEELKTACYEYLQRRIGGKPLRTPDFIYEDRHIVAVRAELLWKAEEETDAR